MDSNTSQLSSEDSDLLDTVERAIAGDMQPASDDQGSLEVLCVEMVASAPVADDTFKHNLLVRLQAEMKVEALPAQSPALTPSKKGVAQPAIAPVPTGRVRETDSKTRTSGLQWSARRSPGYSRAGRAVLGALGVLAMLVLLVALAAQFSRRVDVNYAGKGTPTTVTGSEIATPGSTVIAVGPPIKVTPADALALVPKLKKLYTLPLGVDDGSSEVWSPDGKLLAKASGSIIQVWDVERGTLRNNIPLQGDTSSYTLTWSPNGKMLALTSSIGRVKVYAVKDGALLLTLTPAQAVQQVRFSKPVSKVAWSPDGNYIASVVYTVVNDTGVTNSFITPEHPLQSTVYVWNVATGTVAHMLVLPDDESLSPAGRMVGPGGSLNYVTEVAWSPDGTMISAVFMSQLIAVWDVASEKLRDEFSNPAVSSAFIAAKMQWSPDGQTIAEAQPNFVELWDLATGQSRTMPSPAPPQPVPYPLSTADPRLNPTPTSTYVYAGEGYGDLGAFVWSPDGKKIVTLDGLYSDKISLRLWDPASARLTYRLQVGDLSKFGAIRYTPAFSPDGRVILYGMYDAGSANLGFLDVEAQAEIRSLSMSNAMNASWSPDGSLLAITVLGGIEIWGDPASHGAAPTTIAATTPVPVCGAWSLVNAPMANNIDDLRAVAAIGDDDVWAVGLGRVGSPAYADLTPVPDIATSLTLHWDGKTWRHITAPHVGNDSNQLMGVVGVSSNDVWAVGYTGDEQNMWVPGREYAHTLIVHWDGTVWSVIPAPTSDRGSSRLFAVSALARDDVWAVGYSGGDDDGTYPFNSDSSATSTAGSETTPTVGVPPTLSSAEMARTRTLILHWDGKSWSEVVSPSPGAQSNALYSVSALAKDSIWAVGVTSRDSSLHTGLGYVNTQPFVLFWNGTSWANTPVPNMGNWAAGVSAADDSDAWVVGADSDEGSSDMRMMHWDGSSWAVVAVPTPSDASPPGPPQRNLTGVLALTRHDVWAIGGSSGVTGTRSGTKALHWDGAQWSYVPTPNLNEQDPNSGNQLYALAAAPSGDLWAVGTSYTDVPGSRALIMRYDAATCR